VILRVLIGRRVRLAGVLGLATTAISCTDAVRPTAIEDSQVSALDRVREPRSSAVQCDPSNGHLTLPAGFCALVVARQVGIARQLVVRPNGDIYVAIYGARDGTGNGGVVALRDTTGDGRADIRVKFGSMSGNGIAWRDDQLWFAPHDRVVRYDLPSSALVPGAAPQTIVSRLPATGDHFSKTVVLGSGDDMFVNIGSASNSCQVANRVDFSPGIDPCPELAVRAGVWKYSASQASQPHRTANRFARELRNTVALAINPGDGALYGVQHGRDQLFDNWPTLFTAQDDALLPAEELFRIEAGRAYGWPYCFYDGVQNRKVLAPEYGGDGSRVGRCDDRRDPLADYPAHWAPLSMVFYTGTQFPASYRGGLFIAWHGSRFDPTLQPAGPGYVVTFTSFAGGSPAQTFSTFAGGFAGGNFTPTTEHRPVGLAQGPDGSLYVSDDRNGYIWRIMYRGAPAP
jgi:glucose/arabinose dehydrogenase